VSGKQFVDPRYAKGEEYGRVIEAILKEGNCPFCPAHFKWHTHPRLMQSGLWFITEARWPYPNASRHFLLISEKHLERFDELGEEDFCSVMFLAGWAVKGYDLPGGALALRFGDSRYTGATVRHLHFHLIVPDPEKGHVDFPVG
jgi:ATP adenylyltransferase